MRTILWEWVKRLRTGLIVLTMALWVFFAVVPQGKAAFHTTLFVLQVLELGIKSQSWFTKTPVREKIDYPLPAGPGQADIYRVPDGKPRAAVLLFLGANATGRDDKDVVNLGYALSRSGFVTMFHWSPTMGLRHNIDPAEIENLVWAFQYLASREFVDRDRTGMGGFCVGASFALVAAADPRIRDDVRFVNAFGPYFDGPDLLLQFGSRSRFYAGEREPWEPDQLTKKVLANELIDTVDDARAKEILRLRFLADQDVSMNELAELDPQADMVRQLLEGASLERTEEIYRGLPGDFRDKMIEISPSSHVGQIKAQLLIMHDRNDRLIPAAESRRLADALKERGDFRYTEVQAFDHVRPDSGAGLWALAKEGVKLYWHMYGLVRQAV